MKFLFDEKIDRRNTGSMKWDVNENELPMWVADMDFQTAPEITASMMAVSYTHLCHLPVWEHNTV